MNDWKHVVYPSFIAFLILAGYFFYLVYIVTNDMHKMVYNMEQINISLRMTNQQMVEMNKGLYRLNMNTTYMRKDMQQIGRPMSKFNNMMPW